MVSWELEARQNKDKPSSDRNLRQDGTTNGALRRNESFDDDALPFSLGLEAIIRLPRCVPPVERVFVDIAESAEEQLSGASSPADQSAGTAAAASSAKTGSIGLSSKSAVEKIVLRRWEIRLTRDRPTATGAEGEELLTIEDFLGEWGSGWAIGVYPVDNLSGANILSGEQSSSSSAAPAFSRDAAPGRGRSPLFPGGPSSSGNPNANAPSPKNGATVSLSDVTLSAARVFGLEQQRLSQSLKGTTTSPPHGGEHEHHTTLNNTTTPSGGQEHGEHGEQPSGPDMEDLFLRLRFQGEGKVRPVVPWLEESSSSEEDLLRTELSQNQCVVFMGMSVEVANVFGVGRGRLEHGFAVAY